MPQPDALPIADLIPLMTWEVVATIANRLNEPEPRRAARAEAARQAIQTIEPETGPEILLAGQIAMMEALARDAAEDAGAAAAPEWRHKHRAQAAMLAKAALSMMREIGRQRAARAKARAAEAKAAAPATAAPETDDKPSETDDCPAEAAVEPDRARVVPPLPRPHPRPNGFRADAPRAPVPAGRTAVALTGT